MVFSFLLVHHKHPGHFNGNHIYENCIAHFLGGEGGLCIIMLLYCASRGLERQLITRSGWYRILYIYTCIFTYLLNVEQVNYGNNALSIYTIKKITWLCTRRPFTGVTCSHKHIYTLFNLSKRIKHFSCSPVWDSSRPLQLPQFNTNCLGLNTRAVFFTEHLVVSYPRKPQSSFLKSAPALCFFLSACDLQSSLCT